METKASMNPIDKYIAIAKIYSQLRAVSLDTSKVKYQSLDGFISFLNLNGFDIEISLRKLSQPKTQSLKEKLSLSEPRRIAA